MYRPSGGHYAGGGVATYGSTGGYRGGGYEVEDEEEEINPEEVLPTLRHVRETLSSFQSLRGPPHSSTAGGGGQGSKAMHRYDEPRHDDVSHHHGGGGSRPSSSGNGVSGDGAQMGSYFSGRHDDRYHRPSSSSRPATGTSSRLGGTRRVEVVDERQSSATDTKGDDDWTTSSIQAKTAHWANLARQGNAEVAQLRNGVAEAAAEYDSRPPSGSSRPVSGGSKQRSQKPPASSSAAAPPAADAPTSEREHLFQLREEAELRAVTQLRTELETIKLTHQDVLKDLRLKHHEELAAQKADFLSAQRGKIVEATGRVEKQLLGEKAKAVEQADGLQKDMDAMTRQLSLAQNHVAESEGKITSYKKLLLTHESEIKTQTHAANGFKKKTEELANELDRLRQEHERVKSVAGRTELQVRQEWDQSKKELNIARDDNIHLRRGVDVLQQEKEALTHEFDQLQHSMNARYGDMDKQVADGAKKWKRIKEGLETKVQSAQLELQRAQTALASTEHELNEYKLQTKDLVNSLQGQLKMLEKDCVLQQEKLNNSESKCADRERQLQALEIEVHESRPRLEQLLGERVDLMNRADVAQQDYMRERDRAKSLERAKGKRESETAEMVGSLKSELAAKEKKLAQLAGCRDTNQELAKARAELVTVKELNESYKLEIQSLQRSHQLATATAHAHQQHQHQLQREQQQGHLQIPAAPVPVPSTGAGLGLNTAHERSHERILQQTESSNAKKIPKAPKAQRMAVPPAHFNSTAPTVPIPPTHSYKPETSSGAVRTENGTAQEQVLVFHSEKDEAALRDDDLRPLELKKRQLQEEAHWTKCKATLESQSDQLLQKIRENMRLFDDDQ